MHQCLFLYKLVRRRRQHRFELCLRLLLYLATRVQAVAHRHRVALVAQAWFIQDRSAAEIPAYRSAGVRIVSNLPIPGDSEFQTGPFSRRAVDY